MRLPHIGPYVSDEERTLPLQCGDLFTQPGAEHAPLTRDDILDPSEAMRGGLDYWAHSTGTRAAVERLADLDPRTLACMHGSAREGDGASLLRALADRLEGSPRPAVPKPATVR